MLERWVTDYCPVHHLFLIQNVNSRTWICSMGLRQMCDYKKPSLERALEAQSYGVDVTSEYAAGMAKVDASGT